MTLAEEGVTAEFGPVGLPPKDGGGISTRSSGDLAAVIFKPANEGGFMLRISGESVMMTSPSRTDLESEVRESIEARGIGKCCDLSSVGLSMSIRLASDSRSSESLFLLSSSA